MNRIRVKVCCIRSLDEARLAISYGADAIGLVSRMPSGPGVISEDEIARIARRTPPPVATFLLTSQVQADAIVDQVRRTGVNTVQLCAALAPAELERLRSAVSASVRLVQVIHVEGPAAIQDAVEVGKHVDAILLDSGRPTARIPELGGTGRVHDWSISRQVVAALACPVFLAGGLRDDNIVTAIEQVRPYGVDICSGVRTDGALDATKLGAFVRAVRGAGVV